MGVAAIEGDGAGAPAVPVDEGGEAPEAVIAGGVIEDEPDDGGALDCLGPAAGLSAVRSGE